MSNAEDEKLYAFFYETVVLSYVAYKTTRYEEKAGTRNDWKAAMAASTAAYHFREHLPELTRINNAFREIDAFYAG